jgi:hypothetical protein
MEILPRLSPLSELLWSLDILTELLPSMLVATLLSNGLIIEGISELTTPKSVTGAGTGFFSSTKF